PRNAMGKDEKSKLRERYAGASTTRSARERFPEEKRGDRIQQARERAPQMRDRPLLREPRPDRYHEDAGRNDRDQSRQIDEADGIGWKVHLPQACDDEPHRSRRGDRQTQRRRRPDRV